ncbi:MAG: MFS transporter, partial [Chloroflexi bacterium]|nr:MFS transporter [Chloroflexota bacterium]
MPEADSTHTGRWVLVSTILVSSMAFIDGSALNVALPSLQADLGASAVELLWVVNAYLLMLAALILIGGSLGDHLGRKRVFMAGVALFLAGSLSCGVAPSPALLIAARVVQGAGGAIMIPGSLAIISAYFSPEQRGKAIGTWSSVTTAVTLVGPVLGGLLADAGLWRGVFLINVPIGLVALWMLAIHVPESRSEGSARRIDLAGAALAALGLGGLAYGLTSAPDYGFGDPRVWGSLLPGLAALAAFVWVEAHQVEPMVPLHLFRSPTFLGANLLTLFLYGGLSAFSLFFSLNLVQAQGYSQSTAGLAITPFALMLTLLSRWAGALADRFGPRRFLIGGPALVGVAFVLLALAGQTRGPASYWTAYFPAILLFGAGMGFTVAPLTTSVMNAVETRFAGTASGINNAVSRTAGVLAIAVVGAVALFTFSAGLQTRTQSLELPAPARQELAASAGQLGGAQPPAGLAPAARQQVQDAIRSALINTFQTALWICAGLAWASAAMA